MNDKSALFTDRINDLEDSLVRLQNELNEQKKIKKSNNNLIAATALFLVPLTLIVIISMGLEINYQSDKHQVSYSNNGLVELGLSGLTLLSGIYSLKKYHDSEQAK